MSVETVVGDVWALEMADVVLGRLTVMETLEPWHYGVFEAGIGFQAHADLFHIHDAEGQTKDWDDRQADVHRIRQLEISLKLRDSDRRTRSFSLFVEGDRGRVRIFPEVRLTQ